MTREIINNVAYIIRQICAVTGDKPGKTALQKMVYLMQAEGIELGFKYGIHCYGPYSEALDAIVTLLAADDIVRVERKGSSHLMYVDSAYGIESDLGKETEEKIGRVIEKYKEKGPSKLGLLTTAHYVNRKMADRDLPDIVHGVQKIMGAKYSEEAIKEVIEELDLPGLGGG